MAFEGIKEFGKIIREGESKVCIPKWLFFGHFQNDPKTFFIILLKNPFLEIFSRKFTNLFLFSPQSS
jgi:hypothetical protein